MQAETRLLISPRGSGRGILKRKHRGRKAAVVEVIAFKGDFQTNKRLLP